MEQLNINTILNRGECVEKLKDFLVFFEANKHNLSTRRGVYVYGAPGTGKTYFVKDILRELNYDIIHYDAGDIRNKTVISDLTKYNMSDKNILSMFNKKTEYKKIANVTKKIDPNAPHDVILVLDATSGQNVINQVEEFNKIIPVTGLIMTKLDGTAKGGILLAVAKKYKLPIIALGLGEKEDDLQIFEAEKFAEAFTQIN